MKIRSVSNLKANYCISSHPCTLEWWVAAQSILWHYIEPITTSIDIDSIAFKCYSGKKPIDGKTFTRFIFNAASTRPSSKLYQYFSLISFSSQFNLFYYVVKKNHRNFIWPEAYFYNLISYTDIDWSHQVKSWVR